MARFAKPLQGSFCPVAKHPQKHKNRPEIGRFSHFNPSAEMHPFSLFSASKAPEKWLCDAICRKKQLFPTSRSGFLILHECLQQGQEPESESAQYCCCNSGYSFLSITVTFTLCFIIHRSFATSCSLICSIGSDHTYTSSPLLFPFIWMVLPYICPYRFISLWEIQAPSGRQSVKNCSYLKHLEGHKLIVFARPFTAQSFWTA